MENYLLPQRLKSLRDNKGLSQYDLAKMLGYTRGQIANYEQGTRKPDLDTLQRLADFFGVSVDYLLGRDREIIRKSSLAAHYESQLPIDDDDDLLETIERMLERRRQKKAAKAKEKGKGKEK